MARVRIPVLDGGLCSFIISSIGQSLGSATAASGRGTEVDKMSKVFNFSVNTTNLKRISNGQ